MAVTEHEKTGYGTTLENGAIIPKIIIILIMEDVVFQFVNIGINMKILLKIWDRLLQLIIQLKE